MTLSEAMSTGIQTTITGLAIVFSVLIILMLVMMAMKKIFYNEPAKPQAVTTAPEPAKEPQAASPQEDPNLIAVLTAAVAASLNTSTYNLNIKSYRRVGSSSPAWNKAGLQDTINSRF